MTIILGSQAFMPMTMNVPMKYAIQMVIVPLMYFLLNRAATPLPCTGFGTMYCSAANCMDRSALPNLDFSSLPKAALTSWKRPLLAYQWGVSGMANHRTMP